MARTKQKERYYNKGVITKGLAQQRNAIQEGNKITHSHQKIPGLEGKASQRSDLQEETLSRDSQPLNEV